MVISIGRIDRLARKLAAAARARKTGSLVVALSGIDASGKGYMAERLSRTLERRGLNSAVIHVDDWLAPPEQRFGTPGTGRHFYEKGFLLDSMFEDIVTPLRRHGCIDATVRLGGQSGVVLPHVYRFVAVDLVLLEGIFLLRRELLPTYDETIWMECTFTTALERALRRNQEGLSPERIVHEYRHIYFPAQRHHIERDAPRNCASVVVINDTRLAVDARPPGAS